MKVKPLVNIRDSLALSYWSSYYNRKYFKTLKRLADYANKEWEKRIDTKLDYEISFTLNVIAKKKSNDNECNPL